MNRSQRQDISIADVAPESVLLAGAGCAILLQIARPEVGHGVAVHSDFAANPMKRLQGTLTYIYALTNGTPAQADKARAWVNRAHAPVHSTGSAGRPAYDATDPALQLWVAATLYWTAMRVYEEVFDELPDAAKDKLYSDYAILGTALQVPEGAWPATRAEFEAYWEQTLAQLRVDSVTAQVADELLGARNAPLWVRTAMPLARLLTAGILPEEVRKQFGLPWSAKHAGRFTLVMRFVSVAYPKMPAKVRRAPMRFYLRRLGA